MLVMTATPLLIGLALAIGAAIFARVVGLDRERSFYATVLVVVATYYGLFTVVAGAAADWQGGWWRTLLFELIAVGVFCGLAGAGFKRSQWLVVVGLAGHGVFDFFLHDRLIDNPGVPTWWPAFCGSYDIGAAACLAWLIWSRGRSPSATAGA
jgi:hypothetical protein